MLQASALYREAIAWYLLKLAEMPLLGKKVAHSLYREASEALPLTRSSLQCAALDAVGLLRSYRTNSCRRKASQPECSRRPLQLRQDAYSLRRKGINYMVAFPTLAGCGHQVRLPILLTSCSTQWLAQLESDKVRKGSASLIQRKGRWFLYVTLNVETEQQRPSNVLGVDFGIVNLAVTSDGQFFSGRAVRFRKERLAKLHKTLQEKGRSSRAWKRQHKDRRWMTHVNHCLSKALVAQAKEQNAALALEELTGIRGRTKASKRFNRMMSGWAFAQLRQFVEYKAVLVGVVVLAVDPRSSSRTCSHCGEGGVRTRADFSCKACGFHLHADLNAARNLCQRGMSSLVRERETPLWPTPAWGG
jgi:IS605 OrfB family transposase